IELILDGSDGRQRFGGERDRLAVAVGRGGRARRRFTGQRVEGRADATAEVDQLLLAAASGDRKRQRIEMASAIAKKRQHGPDIGRTARYELPKAILVGTVHLAEQFVPDRANIILKGFPT